MDICPKCNGTGVSIENNLQCSCVLKKALSKYLHPILLQAKSMPKDLKFPISHLKEQKTIITHVDLGGFNAISKYYTSMRFILSSGNFTHLYSTGRELTDTFLADSYDAEKEYLNVDILFLVIGNDPQNKYMNEMLPYVVRQRDMYGKQTWIRIPQNKIEKMSIMYGIEFESMIKDGTIKHIPSFKPLGWNSGKEGTK